MLSRFKQKTKIIVNDVGSINIDAARLSDADVTALTEGCICCEDMESLSNALHQAKGSSELLIVEPSGIAE